MDYTIAPLSAHTGAEVHGVDLTKAIENFHAALRINPRYASAHSALGFAFALQGRLTEATEQFDHALRMRPRQADAHNRR